MGFYYSAFGGDGSERGTTTVRASGQAHVSIVLVSTAEYFSTVSMHGQGGEPPRANRPVRVRIVPCLLYGISRLMPINDNRVRSLLSLPPRGKVDCRSVAKARRMRGKRRYFYYKVLFPSFATRFASLGGEPPRASWLARVRFRHFPSGRLPRRCHLPTRSIVGPLWLKTVTCGLFLRCFTPPRRAPRGKALASTWFLMPFRSPYRFIPANTKPRRLLGRSLRGL